MSQMKHLRQSEVPYSSHSIERRRMRRSFVSLGLMYSGINGDDVLIGDGSAVDLSEGGVGIRGNCPVKIGMELTLFLYLLDEEEPLFVSEVVVSWTKGSLFGVELNEVSLRDGDRLRALLHTQSAAQAESVQ
jgi:Tfp pilus assembly protein PilZ